MYSDSENEALMSYPKRTKLDRMREISGRLIFKVISNSVESGKEVMKEFKITPCSDSTIRAICASE